MNKHLSFSQEEAIANAQMEAGEATAYLRSLWKQVTAVSNRVAALEAQQSAETPQSETPSPVVTSTLEGTSDTLSISYSWSSPASQAGTLPPSVQQAIAALFNLPLHRGHEPVEVTLSIRTPRAATPPSGSPSQSTAGPIPAASGVHGADADVRELRAGFEAIDWLRQGG